MNTKIISQLFTLLTKKEKINLCALGAVMALNAVTEVMGIASIAPLIAVITDPESIQTNSLLNQVYTYFQFKNSQDFTIFLGGVVLCMVVLNNIISLGANYLALRYSNNRERSIGKNLLQTYLYQPYIFFLYRHSAELLRNVFNEIAYISSNIISRLLSLVSRSISAIAIVILIFIINPQTTIIMSLILGLAYTIIYIFIKNPLYRMGRKSVALTEDKLRVITDSIKLIKDIKMQSSEELFLEKFSNTALSYARIRTKSDMAAIAPRYIIEIFAVAALVIAIIYLISTNDQSNEILPLLGVYAFAGFRLMPALQQIFNSLSKIQFSAHSLEVISSEISKYRPISEANRSKIISTLPFSHSFGLQEVSFSYQEDKQIVFGADMEIKKGERIGIIGKSGEGKSTIVDLLIGLIAPQAGGIMIDGKKLSLDDYESWRTNISYTSQSSYLLDDSIDLNISLGARVDGQNADCLTQAKRAALVDFKVEDADSVGENGQRLSGGQKQRIGIARALYQNRPVLILDEATSALDSHTEHKILTNITELKKTLILISHRVETLKFCDRIYIVSNGRIVDSGPYEALNKSSDYFQELLRSNKDS